MPGKGASGGRSPRGCSGPRGEPPPGNPSEIRAAIDIGSNTIRLLVAEWGGSGLSFLHTRLETTRLGAGLGEGGSLDRGAAERSMAVLRSYLEDARRLGAARVAAVGTGALRDAVDGGRFAAEVLRETGLAVDIIDQAAEAALTLMGVESVLGSRGDLAALDIGGRSTEVILRRGAAPPSVFGFRLGVVSLAERFPGADPPDRRSLEAMRRRLDAELAASSLPRPLHPGIALAGCGGTVTTLAALDLGLAGYDRERINRHLLPASRVEELLGEMASMGAAARARLPGMAPDRADIIIPGAVLLLALLSRLGRGGITVSDAGILEGCILKMGKMGSE